MKLDIPHIYGDMLEIYNGNIDFSGTPDEIVRRLQQAQLGQMSMTCYRCMRMCNLPEAEIDMSGTPCTDHCHGGLHQRVMGPAFPVLAIYCQLLVLLRVLMFIHDNSALFDETVIDRLTHGIYRLFPLRSSPAHMGFGLIERDRQYLMGVDKERAEIIADPRAIYAHVVSVLSTVITEPQRAQSS